MYDYVFVYNEQALPYPVPSWLETVASGPKFRLLRVPERPQARIWIAPDRMDQLMQVLQRRAGLLLFVLLLALVCYPVLATQYLPLADYPNHLARIYVLAEGRGSEFLRLYYTPMIQAQPNLAMDLFVLAVHPPLSIEAAGKACIVFAFLLIASGAHVLHRVVAGRWSPWPSVVLLFLYNRLFYWGFIGFIVGLGTLLYGVALWIALRERPWQRLAASCVFAVILYIVHLFAFCAYAVAIGGYELYGLIAARAGWPQWRRALALGGAQFIVPAILFIGVSPTAGAADRITWGVFFKKIAGLVYTTSSYNLIFDAVCLAVLVVDRPGGPGLARRVCAARPDHPVRAVGDAWVWRCRSRSSLPILRRSAFRWCWRFSPFPVSSGRRSAVHLSLARRSPSACSSPSR